MVRFPAGFTVGRIEINSSAYSEMELERKLSRKCGMKLGWTSFQRLQGPLSGLGVPIKINEFLICEIDFFHVSKAVRTSRDV
jgi:hypothetical protein